MSFVITMMSYVLRRRLHRASTSAVLPDPTGPPIPTRRGPVRKSEFQMFVMSEITSCIVFHDMGWESGTGMRPITNREVFLVELLHLLEAQVLLVRRLRAARPFAPKGST